MSVFEQPPRRKRQLKLVMTDEEKDRLDQAAKRLGYTVADLVRVAVNEFVDRELKRTGSKKRP